VATASARVCERSCRNSTAVRLAYQNRSWLLPCAGVLALGGGLHGGLLLPGGRVGHWSVETVSKSCATCFSGLLLSSHAACKPHPLSVSAPLACLAAVHRAVRHLRPAQLLTLHFNPNPVQGGSGGGAVGLISNLRSYLWIPISQNSYRCACCGAVSWSRSSAM